MEEISLNLKYKPIAQVGFARLRQEYDTTRNEYVQEMQERIEDKKPVFVKFASAHPKRPNAIALVKSIKCERKGDRDGYSRYTAQLKWDDRKNTAKVDFNNNDVVYLPKYEGKTVWFIFDAAAFAKKNAKKVCDRLGREIKEGDVVTYINARYGSGATIDFGVVQKIVHKASRGFRSSIEIETTVHIETIAVEEGERVEASKITRPERSIMVMTDVDLFDEAFVAKLTVAQL